MFKSSSLVIWFYTVCITIHNFLEAISLEQGYVFPKFIEIIAVLCMPYYIPQAQQSPYFIRPKCSAKYIYLLVFNYQNLCRI